MPSVSVFATELAEVARNLRQAGDEDLYRELQDGISRAIDPLPRAIHDRLPEYLPNPYAEVLDADLVIKVSKRTGRSHPGITVTAPERGVRSVERRRLIRLDRGILEHPLFGNRKHWYPQPVKEGFFTRTAEDTAPRVRQELEDALARVEDKIFKGAHR